METSNGVIIRAYQPSDYITIKKRPFDEKTFLDLPNVEATAHNLARGPAFTGTSNGDIIACGGVLIFWKGVGEAWAATSPLVEKFRLVFVKTIHDKLQEIIRYNQLERVQTVVDVEHKVSQAWLERMGFVNETPDGMRKYLGGRTFYRYALVKGD